MQLRQRFSSPPAPWSPDLGGSSSSSLGSRGCADVHPPMAPGAAARAVLRAAAIGAAGRTALGLLSTILRRRIGPRAVADAVLTRDPLRWAAVLAGWAAFPALCALLAAAVRRLASRIYSRRAAAGLLRERPEPASLPHIVTITAAMLAAAPAAALQRQTRTELGLYLMSRALHGAAVARLLPRLPTAMAAFPHYPALLLAPAASLILYCYTCAPECHSPKYLRFLHKAARRDPRVPYGAAAAMRRQVTPDTLELCGRLGVAPPAGPDDLSVVCRLTHPATDSCNASTLTWAAKTFVTRGLPLYLPLKLAALAINWRVVAADPAAALLRAAVGTARSALFLSLFCAGPFRALCASVQLGVRRPWIVGAISGSVSAPALLLEAPGRRLDLVLYAVAQSLRAGRVLLFRRGVLPRVGRAEQWALYGAAVALLMHQWRHAPETLHPRVRGAMDFVIGAPPQGVRRALSLERSGDGDESGESGALSPVALRGPAGQVILEAEAEAYLTPLPDSGDVVPVEW